MGSVPEFARSRCAPPHDSSYLAFIEGCQNPKLETPFPKLVEAPPALDVSQDLISEAVLE